MNRFALITFALVAAAAPVSAITLGGTQAEAVVTIPKGATANLTDAYTVPAGRKLILEGGSTIVAAKGAKIIVDGDLEVKGTATAPVVGRGQKWAGIRLSNTAHATIVGLQVGGAEHALEAKCEIDAIEACVFSKNKRGLTLAGKKPTALTDCLFTENDEYGLSTDRGAPTLKACTFVKNKGYGINAGDGSPAFDGCLFADNAKGGITQDNAGMSTSIHGTGCSFEGKATAITICMGHGSANFPKCYWGDKATAQLKAKGPDTNLPTVLDARDGRQSVKIFVPDFLTSAPKPCGATVKSRL